MNRLDTSQPLVAFYPASFADLEAGRRLIVLVPDAEADYTPAIRRIWELANALGSRVQFLGLYRDAAEEPRLRRQLVTLSALLEDGTASAEVRVEFGTDWLRAIQSDLRAGDQIACFAGQRAGLSRRPLSQILESNLDVPVTILANLYRMEHSGSSWIRQTIAWTGSIGIIVGFFWLQVRMDQLTRDWAYTTLLIMSILVEVWLVWVWNSIFG